MKKRTLLAVIGVISFVVYNLLVFTIGGFVGHTAVFWLSYAFVILGFGVVAASFWLLGESGMEMKDWLFGLPVVRHCVHYCVAEILVSVLLMIFERAADIRFAVAVQIILLAIYLVFAIACYISKMAVSEVHEKVAAKTQYLQLLRADAELNVVKCMDPETKAACQKLAEEIRYSDPVSHASLQELEQKLQETVRAIGGALEQSNNALAQHLCQQASLQLAERNLKTKALK